MKENNIRGPLDLEQRIADLTGRLEKAEAARRPLDTMMKLPIENWKRKIRI